MSGMYIIVASQFNAVVVERLVEGAKKKWIDCGVEPSSIHVQWVPGAVELPLAVQHVIEKNRPEAVCAVGCVIRGGTPHFDYVCQAATSGIMQVMLRTSTPIGFGLLTTEDLMQAFDRADGKMGNKGAEAALAAFEMASLMKNSK